MKTFKVIFTDTATPQMINADTVIEPTDESPFYEFKVGEDIIGKFPEEEIRRYWEHRTGLSAAVPIIG